MKFVKLVIIAITMDLFLSVKKVKSPMMGIGRGLSSTSQTDNIILKEVSEITIVEV